VSTASRVPPGHAAAIDEALRLHRQGKLREAFERYAAILARDPVNVSALHLSGVALFQSGNAPLAIDRIRQAIAIDSKPPEPWANLAQALGAIGRHEAAANALREAASRAPQQPEIWSNLAAAELSVGRAAEAEAVARNAIKVDPVHPGGWFNLALALEKQGRVLEALDAASRAASLPQDQFAPAGLLAQLHEGIGQLDRARKVLETALAQWPAATVLHAQLARVAERAGDLPAATAALANVLRLDPKDGAALSQLIFLRKQVADWHDLAALRERFRAGVAAGRAWLTPFSLLSDPSTRAEQRRAAERWSALFPTGQPAPRAIITPPSGRLRIGYLSSDFHEHPTALLTAGLFEHHDRGRFEIVGYSTGPNDGSAARARVVAAFDRFVDAATWDADALARRIRADGIDILVDLKGHTAQAPTAALARRPAPIQVHYLGYPGTLGAPFVDYLIGDPVVTPREHAADYAELLVELPWSYQVNDRSREAAATPPRDALGLPAGAVVLCCFNSTYKLNPEVLDAWARILAARADTVLWLLARSDGDPATDNLRREIASRGIDPARLVFAAHRPRAEYLALYRHADLFLDTWPYNAHTTASDALWMGCPVVTWLGPTFAGRVGASLLRAVGLPELVADDVDAYVEKAVALAGDAAERARLRAHLEGPGRASPLFDAAETAQALEAAYLRMADDYRRGVKVAFRVEPVTPS
jgi:predicted O-linked N-acetylglucosamine transferase (SPINDLY family)